jgi:hypothetical protein
MNVKEQDSEKPKVGDAPAKYDIYAAVTKTVPLRSHNLNISP